MSPRKQVRLFTAGIALTALGATGSAAISTAAASTGARHSHTFTDYAFDVNDNTNNIGFFPVPGSNAGALVQGDGTVVNDQITTSHKAGGGYPIIGYDSGSCIVTRAEDKNAPGTLSNCVVTARLPHGSLTVQGVIRYISQKPITATLAVTGGTGSYAAARGTVRVTFAKDYKVLQFTLTGI
jgi:hypothetical protein